MRAAFLVGCALWLASSAARADDKPPPELVKQVVQRWKRARASTGCCYRETIPEALSASLRGQKLARKDRPLAVGERLPAIAGLPAGRPLAIVFYRGHW